MSHYDVKVERRGQAIQIGETFPRWPTMKATHWFCGTKRMISHYCKTGKVRGGLCEMKKIQDSCETTKIHDSCEMTRVRPSCEMTIGGVGKV